MKTRPFGVTLLAILAGIAAFLAIVHTLQFLHLLPFNLGGTVRFFAFDSSRACGALWRHLDLGC
jgi:hypothetical protein